jgi:hypothetical protein
MHDAFLDAAPDSVAIVRAYDGRPLKRIVVDQYRDVWYIANPRYLDEIRSGKCKPIGFRRTTCFAWDAAAFERLERIYAATGTTQDTDWIPLPMFQGLPAMAL